MVTSLVILRLLPALSDDVLRMVLLFSSTEQVLRVPMVPQLCNLYADEMFWFQTATKICTVMYEIDGLISNMCKSTTSITTQRGRLFTLRLAKSDSSGLDVGLKIAPCYLKGISECRYL